MSGNAVRETLGFLAVVAGLVFVGMEIRQNTQSVQSATVQALAEQSFDATALVLENESLRNAYYLALEEEPLSVDEQRELDIYYHAVMRIQQNRFYQAQLGVMDREILFGLGGRVSTYQMSYFADFWERWRNDYPDDFRSFVEEQFDVIR